MNPLARGAGAVFGSVSARQHRLLADDLAVRVPLPRCRRIGFVALANDSGRSTTLAAVAGHLRRRRPGPVLVADTRAQSWENDIAPAIRFHDVAVIDWGVRHPAYLGPALDNSDILCLVAPAEPAAAGSAVGLADDITRAGIQTPVVVALVQGRRGISRTSRRLLPRAETAPTIQVTQWSRTDVIRLAAILVKPST